MTKQKPWIFSALLSCVIVFSTNGAFGQDVKVGGAQMTQTNTIFENSPGSSDYSTLVAAVKAAGLTDTFLGKGPFTIFAPTDEAFGALPDGAVATLLQPENKAALTKLVNCHVVNALDLSTTISKMIKEDGGEYDIKTLGGCVIKAKENFGAINLTDETGYVARITLADLSQSNGVLHVIDQVMLPADSAIVKVHASRIFAGPSQYPPAQFKAYGLLAFRTMATESDLKRHQHICSAYLNAINRSSDLNTGPGEQMVTVWPIDTDSHATQVNKLSREKTCQHAIQFYGLATSQLAILEAGRINTDLEGRGPFLLAWSPATSKGKETAVVLMADLSDVDDGEEANAIMIDWVQRIESNSDVWNPSDGWNIKEVKKIIRDWANKYGRAILGIVQ